jgi:hypothetical protein
MNAAECFFSDEEKRQISEATQLAQAGKCGEIAVPVAEFSDDYPDADAIGGFLLGGSVSLFFR